MLTFVSHAHSKPTPKIWSCNGGKDFAHWIFPDLFHGQYTRNKKYNECDIVVGCSIATTAGSNVYVNGERKIKIMTEFREKDVYLGPTGGLKTSRNALWVPVPAVRSVLTTKSTKIAFEKVQHREERNEFMAYIQSNCVPYRENAFNMFAMEARRRNSKSPHAYGRCCGSFQELKIGGKNSWTHKGNRDIFKRYKFALVMENENYPGYVTEKIVNGFFGGAIPVYYGTTDIFKLFNKAASCYGRENAVYHGYRSVCMMFLRSKLPAILKHVLGYHMVQPFDWILSDYAHATKGKWTTYDVVSHGRPGKSHDSTLG